MQEPKCLEIDQEKRKRLLRPMFWTFMFSSFGIPLISLLLLFCLPKDFYYGNLFGYLLGLGVFWFLPSLIFFGLYYMDLSGTSSLQRIVLYPDHLESYGEILDLDEYSPSIKYRIKMENVSSFTVTRYKIKIKGNFSYEDSKGKKKEKHHFSIVRSIREEDQILSLLDLMVLQYQKNSRPRD